MIIDTGSLDEGSNPDRSNSAWITTEGPYSRSVRDDRFPSIGHVWQGRIKALPIEDDNHLVTVVRDVDQNPLRALRLDRGSD